MIAVLDVHYHESTAMAAAVVFQDWHDSEPVSEYTVQGQGVQDYVPGEFFKRELPCLMSVLAQVRESLHAIVVDGYVSLGDKPGLGMHLSDALNGKVPIIGIAKTRYHSASALEITRGRSQTPLFVTAVGIDAAEAAQNVKLMAGEFRIPVMLKRADQLARTK